MSLKSAKSPSLLAVSQASQEGPSALLQDLPSSSIGAFSNFDPSAQADPPPVYLPLASDVAPDYYTIPVERKRCLVRALTARSASICGKRPPSTAPSAAPSATVLNSATMLSPAAASSSAGAALSSRPTSRGSPSGIVASQASPALRTPRASRTPDSKRLRLSTLDHERKQQCIRIAISAACKQSDPPHCLHALRDTWARDPRAKQTVCSDIRRALAASVRVWTTQELREYLLRAGLQPGSMARHEMARSVEAHISPDRSASSPTSGRTVAKSDANGS